MQNPKDEFQISKLKLKMNAKYQKHWITHWDFVI